MDLLPRPSSFNAYYLFQLGNNLYQIALVVNLSLGSIQFTTTTTPLVRRGSSIAGIMASFEYQLHVAGPTILGRMVAHFLSRV